MTETIFGKRDAVLVFSLGSPSRDLCPILQPTTRGRFRCFGHVLLQSEWFRPAEGSRVRTDVIFGAVMALAISCHELHLGESSAALGEVNERRCRCNVLVSKRGSVLLLFCWSHRLTGFIGTVNWKTNLKSVLAIRTDTTHP